jgi:DNA-binding MarR family transcriptional regulator
MNAPLGRRSTTTATRPAPTGPRPADYPGHAQADVARDAPTPADTESSAATWWEFTSAHERLSAHLNRSILREHGLSLSETSIIVKLRETQGSLVRINDLARDLQWERSRLSHQLTRMESRGLVVREHDPRDGRAALISLTPKGNRAADAAGPTYWTLVDRLFLSGISPEHLTTLTKILGHILDATEEPHPPPEH